MPLYEYKCTKCNSHFEKLQKFSDPPLNVCDVCHQSGGVERLLSTPAFHLKGGGWYKDGYSGSGGKTASETKTETKTETKSDSKPAASPSTTTASTSSSSSDSK